ncbi:MAG: PucR family transcriptional regulator [Acetobacterium sp.]
MSIILSDLFTSTQSIYKLKLLAGEDGLNTPINWVQFTEDSETTHFLRGGELIITTGLSSKSDHWLFDFIFNLIKQKTGGLIINTGHYIFSDSISAEVINLCNKNHFPLFIMPWKIHLSDIMQDYNHKIFMQTNQDDRTIMAFYRLLFHPDNLETSIDTLNSLGYKTTASYQVIVTDKLETPSTTEILLRKTAQKQFLLKTEEHYIFIMQDASLLSLTDEIINFNKHSLSNSGHLISFGIGDITNCLFTLHLSYERALFALKVAQHQELNYKCFDDLGMFKVFYSVENKELLTAMYKDRLAVLENYDLAGNTNLTEILRLYLDNDGSIQAVAEATFTHCNTINYRMKKIRQLLKNDIISMAEKFDLYTAFLIKDFLSF